MSRCDKLAAKPCIMDMITDEYRLLRRLGRGGMGEVWEAARIKDNGVVVPCAIKLLHADITETARERRLFFDEARIATQLDHSRIVKVIDVGTSRSGQPFLVMERVDGIDLRFFLKEAEAQKLTPLDTDIITYIIGEVLAALDYAHDRTIAGADAGIIHSDVTPGNILISSSGEVKLTDFGIARFAATAGPMSRAIGTPRYMAPEQIAGHPRRETDIYGLGVVLHEMLDDRRFLDGLSPDDFRARVVAGPPPDLERREPIPPWLEQLRRRMIATDYRDRPRASEARAVLIEHCPRYLAAGEQLKSNYYARLIGRRRSGVSQLLARADDEHAAGLIPHIGQRALDAKRPEPPAPTRTHTAKRANQLHLAAPQAPSEYEQQWRDSTEVLPATEVSGVSSEQAISVVESAPVVDRFSLRLRWVAIASGVAALAMLVPVSVQMLRQKSADVAVPETEPTKTVTIGVAFVIKNEFDGSIKVGDKVAPTKQQSALLELRPGTYEVSLKPTGSTTWTTCGKLVITDIHPLGQRVDVSLSPPKVEKTGTYEINGVAPERAAADSTR